MKNKTELLEQLKFHWEENMRIDDLLTNQCEKEIQHLIDESKYLEAKEYTRNFFGEYRDYSIGADMIFSKINRMLTNTNK